jgi:hypothetical protein
VVGNGAGVENVVSDLMLSSTEADPYRRNDTSSMASWEDDPSRGSLSMMALMAVMVILCQVRALIDGRIVSMIVMHRHKDARHFMMNDLCWKLFFIGAIKCR